MVKTQASYRANLYRVSGNVQGVGFRYFVLRRAGDLGLVGSVRNLPGGGLEVRAGGPPRDLARLEQQLVRGPASAEVSSVSTMALDPAPQWQRFEITYF